jgi:MGT family glycosyltransferase
VATVLFMPESAYGATNNCIGIGALLRRLGHRVVFAAESSWRGRLAPLGFEEAIVDLSPPESANADPARFWTDFITQTASEFRRPTFEQLSGFMLPTWQAIVDGARYCQEHLADVLDRVRPDVVVEDNVVCFPALLTCGAPFVRIVSCNPLEIRGPGVPPPYSGLPTDDASGWAEFQAEYDRLHRPLWAEFADWVRAQGGPQLPDLEFISTSDHANLYVYPEAVDYHERRPLDGRWLRLDSSVRSTDPALELPPQLLDRPTDSALIYLSLGSLGSADVELMRRLVGLLAETRHRYVVSTGPRHAEYELPPNMWGDRFLPQTRVLPQVDLVITHGGNNTTTESLHFGKPMVLLPLFWDQHDNAQRMHETGFGVRLQPYEVSAGDLRSAIDRLLADRALADRLTRTSAAIRAREGVGAAARTIDRLTRVAS